TSSSDCSATRHGPPWRPITRASAPERSRHGVCSRRARGSAGAGGDDSEVADRLGGGGDADSRRGPPTDTDGGGVGFSEIGGPGGAGAAGEAGSAGRAGPTGGGGRRPHPTPGSEPRTKAMGTTRTHSLEGSRSTGTMTTRSGTANSSRGLSPS